MLSRYNFLQHNIIIKSYFKNFFIFSHFKNDAQNFFLSKREGKRAVEKWEPAQKRAQKEHMRTRTRAQVTSAAAAGAQVRQTSTGHARGRSSSNSQAGREREKSERERGRCARAHLDGHTLERKS